MNDVNNGICIFLVKIMKIISIIYGIYLICITIFNMSLKETQGKVTYIHKYESTYYSPEENEN
jgi:hypothetical protein